MKILVTGAGGFLGRYVVRELLKRGHAVRAQVRSTGSVVPKEWDDHVEVVRHDLGKDEALQDLFTGVNVLVHLAASMRGDAQAQYAGTVTATERLLKGLRDAGSACRVVLASSCSVYDWSAADTCLTEGSDLEAVPGERDGYTRAKLAQEQAVWRLAKAHGWPLAVLRPGLIYGPGATPAASAGIKAGKIFLVVAPSSRLRLTHAENCAAAFADAVEATVEGSFNIIDDEKVSAWQYSGRLLRLSPGTFRVVFPYNAGFVLAGIAEAVASALPGAFRRRLPGLLKLRIYRARFRPFEYDNTRAKSALGWKPKPFFQSGCDVI